ncbi:MAG TPA: 50S ribosomal protein L25 [Anaerolineae bacterium]|nr:50S ribosomal protein L25 [Anaerolineae bacterium]HNT04894.1 50S ribosomal protein L25 [Anaerolineae bacterium]
MEQILLDAELRSMTGKAVKQLRRKGYVPGVVYGHHTAPMNVQVAERPLQLALRSAGTSHLITLNLPDQPAPKMVLVRELQRDPLKHTMQHVDFYEVIMTEKIKSDLPIILAGESRLVKSGNGLLLQGLDSVEIECLPGDLPPEITIDLSTLTEVGQTVLVRDLHVGDAVQILTDLDEMVVKILPPAAEEVEETPAPAEAAEVEVVGKKGKAEEEETEEGAAAAPAGKEKAPAAAPKDKQPAAEKK